MDKRALDHSLEYIASWLRFRYDEEEIPGFVVAVSHRGNMLLEEAFGYADVESGVPLTTRHMFRVASHSKTFTATAIMQLVESGKMRLDDTMATYLPWLSDHRDPRFGRLMLRQVLSHGAGIIRDGLDSNYWQLARPFPDAARLTEEVLDAGLVLDANVKLKYSNFGYSLLGMAIEAAAQQSYDEYLTKNVIGPLGLARTAPDYREDMGGDLVTGYSLRDGERKRLPVPNVGTGAMAPATGFCSTARDLCTYFSAHFVGSGKLLDDDSKREMQRIHWHAHRPGQGVHEDYGLGMILELLEKRHTIGHSGGFPGHITKSMADPEDQLVVVALTSCSDGPARPICKGVYSIIDYFQEHLPESSPRRRLARLEGRYFSLSGIADVIALGDRAAVVSPDSWEPFAEADELEAVDPRTLRIVDTSSFGSEGELVRFDLEGGKVRTLSYAGSMMWPEEAWKGEKRRLLAAEPNGGHG